MYQSSIYYCSILFMLLLLPLPFGSSREVFQWLWVVYVAVFSIVVFSSALIRKQVQCLNVGKVGKQFFLLAVLIVIWSGIQVLDIGLTKSLTLDKNSVHDLNMPTVSIDPRTSIGASAKILSHSLFFCIILHYCRTSSRAIGLLMSIAVLIAGYSVYGLVIYFSGNEFILWYPKEHSINALSSSFVNRNNFATYATLGLIIFVAWGMALSNRASYSSVADSRYLTFSFSSQSAANSVVGSIMWVFLALTIVTTALMLTGSRAGIFSGLSGALATAIFLFGLRGAQAFLPRALKIAALLVLPVLAVMWFSGGLLFDRLAIFEYRVDERLLLYPVTVEIISAHPFTGYGLGNFEAVFKVFRSEEIGLNFVRAHNEYLEFLLGLGVGPFLLLFYIIFSAIRKQIRSLRKSPQHLAFSAVPLGTTLAVALHSFLDFPLQIPAISYTLIAVLAAGFSLTTYTRQAHWRSGVNQRFDKQ